MKHTPEHNKYIGNKGEDIACMFLMKRGYKITERNHLRKWGEIDIIARRGEKLHFIEVKTVSRESLDDVTYETKEGYNPEDNVHFRKRERLARVFSTYVIENGKDGLVWQFDIVCVYLCEKENRALVKIMEDIIL